MIPAVPNPKTSQGTVAWASYGIPVLTGLLSFGLLAGFANFFSITFWQSRDGVPLGFALLLGGVSGLLVRQRSLTLLISGLFLTAALFVLGLPAQNTLRSLVFSALVCGLGITMTRYALRGLKLSNPSRVTWETLGTRYLRASGFVFFGTLVVFPFYWMLLASFKSSADLLAEPTFLGLRPENLNLSAFVAVMRDYNFAQLMFNSTYISLVTVALTLVLAISGAYAIARLQFPGRDALAGSILLIYLFPAIVLAIPLYVMFAQVGLRDTHAGLLVVYLAQTVPVALYMLRSYFETLPKDLEEAGMVDGLTRLGVIVRITLPLALPALASVALYTFMIAWNEFLFANLLLDTPELFTLSKGMVTLNNQEVPRQYLMAGAVIVTLPVMVLFFLFERYLVGGLTAGGVKG